MSFLSIGGGAVPAAGRREELTGEVGPICRTKALLPQ
jgi:hypothetical protein